MCNQRRCSEFSASIQHLFFLHRCCRRKLKATKTAIETTIREVPESYTEAAKRVQTFAKDTLQALVRTVEERCAGFDNAVRGSMLSRSRCSETEVLSQLKSQSADKLEKLNQHVRLLAAGSASVGQPEYLSPFHSKWLKRTL